MAFDGRDDSATWLLDQPPTPRQRQAAYIVIFTLLAVFAATAPFHQKIFFRSDGFIPTLEALMFLTDLITSILLFSQFSIYGSRALLVLASGYLFTALIIIPHLLSFPGAYAPGGLFGANIDTTGWLYYSWHLGLPLTLLAYAWLKKEKTDKRVAEASTTSAIAWSVLLVTGLVCSLAWFAFAGGDFIPHLFLDRTYVTSLNLYVGGFVLLIGLIAVAVLWITGRSVLDQWLLVVAVATTTEIGQVAITSGRYTLVFYVGRVTALVTAATILVVLLAETTKLYARLARSNQLLERERQNKLMNVQAAMAAVAPEVRQPLAAIAANGGAALRFLAKVPPNHDEVQAALDRIVRESHHTSEVFDGLRVLFRKVDEGKEPVDINKIIVGVLQSLRSEFQDHGVEVRSELSSELLLVDGHRSQLEEVIFNLVRNAIEAMDTTTDRDRVLGVITQPRDDAIAVAVEDTGPGIDPKRIERIFDAFMTTKSKGTGLGLAICRMIIEHHGGQLTASADGKNGASFQFVLPANANTQLH